MTTEPKYKQLMMDKKVLDLLDFPEEDSVGWNLALDMTEEEDEAHYPMENDEEFI